jgi:hypothetical protein
MNHPSALKLIIVLLCCASAASAAKKPKKDNGFKGVTVEEFSDPLKNIIAAARQGFEPIKGEFDLIGAGNNQWKTTAWLPGAVSCALVKSARQIQNNVLTPEYFFYTCYFWSRGSTAELLSEYEKLVSFVSQTTGWKYVPTPAVAQRHRVQFHGETEDPWMLIDASPDKVNGFQTALAISIFPHFQSTVLTPPAGSASTSGAAPVSPDGSQSSATSVREEIEKIKNGPYSAMPPAQRSQVTVPSALGGRTAMTVKNSTQYALSVYFDGPVSRSLSLSPGASQTVDLSPGAFHVAGRVVAANVLPFYGDDTYQSSAEYNLIFYIQ